MKRLLAILLLIAFTSQCFNNAFIVFSFYVNQKMIAATLCENRYRPMLHCDGKCQLAKKIKQSENQERQNPERKLENKNEVISSRSFFITDFQFTSANNKQYSDHPEGEPTDAYSKAFHPPCA